MVKKSAFLALMLAAAIAVSATSSLAGGGPVRQPEGKRPVITDLVPQLSGSKQVLYLVGARLFDIVRVVGGRGILRFPNPGTVYQIHGINDGPDGCDPLGVKVGGGPRSDLPPTPANTPVP